VRGGKTFQSNLYLRAIPTLVIAGQHDPLIPLDHAERLAAGLPQAELVVLEETGHGNTDPGSVDGAKYQAAIRRFLEQLPPTAMEAREAWEAL
jgi:pimeloyl-ACP methyl ester carboxylesterase